MKEGEREREREKERGAQEREEGEGYREREGAQAQVEKDKGGVHIAAHGMRFTICSSRLTIRRSRSWFMLHDSQFTVH